MTPSLILFGFLFTICAAAALGRWLMRQLPPGHPPGEALFFGFLTGSALLSTLLFGLCSFGFAYPAVVFAVGGLAIAALAANLRWTPPSLSFSPYFLVFAAFGMLYFFHAMAPEMSSDGITYHLGLTGRILREHGFHRIDTNFYANMPQGLEMLFLMAYAFGRHSSAALVHFGFLTALAYGVVLYGRRIGSPHVGLVAAAFVFVCPVVGLDGSSAYNDVALAAVLFGSFYALQIWDRDQRSGFLVIAGLLAGFAFAIKYTGIVGLIYALGFVFSRRRSVSSVCAVLAFASIGIVPWLAKNWILAGNPIAPFGNALFPNPYVHLSFENAYVAGQRSSQLSSLWEIPWALTITGKLVGTLGPLFLLSPLALLAARKEDGRKLLLAALIFSLPWLGNSGCRFLIPSVPLLSLAMAMVFTEVRGLAPSLVIAHVLISWPGFLQKRLLPATSWSFSHVEAKAALRITPETTFLRERLYEYPHARLIQDLTPPGSKILSMGNTAESYTSREVLVSFQSAFNESAWDLLRVATEPAEAPTKRYTFAFPSQHLSRVRLMNAAVIHEVHFFHGSEEIAPDPQWRTTADPNPWDAHLALDGNAATRWRIWQPPAPGMYLEIDFGRALAVDRVVVECPAAHSDLSVNGVRPDVAEAPPADLRRAAIEALKLRGIEYMLVRDSEPLASEFRQRAAQWGIEELGSSNQARLYRFE